MNKGLTLLAAVCALLVAADLVYHKHTYFPFEEWFAFHAWYGFAGIIILVFGAKALRRLVMRDEDYYDR
ncbi:MAG: hypothetical protein WD803_01290 [Gammaproteobacteria bacterium]